MQRNALPKIRARANLAMRTPSPSPVAEMDEIFWDRDMECREVIVAILGEYNV
ncbi:MAG: hypothetical protein P4K80_06360 [Acidobacteriaceae bacterium]|nr:hypothetical protein [Acidobacteriaceae bacterium]